MNLSTKFDRRKFLHSGMRYGLLLGMAAMGLAAEAKRRRLENDPNCVRIWTCADCAEFGQCSKPKALSAAAAAKEGPLPQSSEPQRQLRTRGPFERGCR